MDASARFAAGAFLAGVFGLSACVLSDYAPPGGSGGAAGEGAAGSSGEGGSGGAGGPVGPEVACGDRVCKGGEVCCMDQKALPMLAQCLSADNCSLLAVPCDGPEDCIEHGGYCCGEWNDAEKVYTSIGCADSCDAIPAVTLCHPAQGASACLPGQMCTPEPVLGPGYGFCEGL